MDLIRKLRHWVLARPRALVVGAPGTEPLRWAVEAELDGRGWALAESPADTDLLLVLGVPGPQLSTAVDVLWGQVPQPRHRLAVADESQVHDVLATAVPALVHAAAHPSDTSPQVLPSMAGSSTTDTSTSDGHHRTHEAMNHASHGGGEHAGHDAALEGMDHSAHEEAGSDGAGEGGHRHGDMDEPTDGSEHSGHVPTGHDGHGGHGGGHGDHHMHHGGTVAGLEMAETAPDRDGLWLDVLRVSLGPVLPGWPMGLVLQAHLQGDVITDAQLSWLDDGHGEYAAVALDSRRAALDNLASLLWTAGWLTAARDARRARDGLGSADPPKWEAAAALAARVARRVRRSRSLAWVVRETERRLPSDHAVAGGGDILDRIRRMCDVAAGCEGAHLPVATLHDLRTALIGAELGTARLLVASVALNRTAPLNDAEMAHG